MLEGADSDRPMVMKPFNLEDLQANQEFLRRLSRRLVRDEGLADDLVQETWLVALQATHDGLLQLRPWLATVMRRLFLKRRRTDDRREARERRVAREEAIDDDREMQAVLEMQVRVLEELQGLPEAQRRVLFLRYSEGLGPSAIAARLGVPVPTVKTRLARGRESLRQRLDREFGSRADWCRLLLPFLPFSGIERAPALGVLGMHKLAKLAIALMVLTVGGLWIRSAASRVAAPPALLQDSAAEEGELSTGSELVVGDGPGIGQPSGIETRKPVIVGTTEADVSSTKTWNLRGQVFDAAARPLPGVRVRQRSSAGATLAEAQTDSAPDGRFEMRATRLGGSLRAGSGPWITLLAPLVRADADSIELPLIVARRVQIAGRVVDSRRRPLTGAQLEFRPPGGLRKRFDLPLDQAVDLPRRTQSVEEGAFRMEIGECPGATLLATLEGYLPSMVALGFSAGEQELEIVLRSAEEVPESIHGQVVDRFGWPVEGAFVSLGDLRVRSDANGAFHLPLATAGRAFERMTAALKGPSRSLHAVHPDHQPARLQVPLDPTRRRALWPNGVVLELGPAPLSIAGRVLDVHGDVLADAHLWLLESTYFSGDEGGCSIEALMGMGPGERHLTVRSDEHGAFRLEGLAEGEYTVVACDPASFQQVHSARVAAGTEDLVLQMAEDGLWSEVHGRVLSKGGEPQAGVEVNVMLDLAALHKDGAFIRTSSWLLGSTETDAQGEFSLRDLPKRHGHLYLAGSSILSARIPCEDLGDSEEPALEQVELSVARRVHLRVTLREDESADEIGLLAADHLPLGMQVQRGKPGPLRMRMPVEAGRTEILSVSDEARFLILYREGQEVGRRAITLFDEGVNER